MNEEPDNPQVLIFPPLLWALTTLSSVLVHHFIFRGPAMLRPNVAQIVGIGCLSIAPLLAGSAFIVMKRGGTNVNPSAPALAIVRGGPYRFTRNPMYLALCLLQAGVAFLLNDLVSLLFLVLLALILHFGVILREERYLERKFGEPYLDLKRSVRRWI